ncbi:MarC family protein, partial [Paramuribaculum intestinale]|uniref:MarC family protein n=1 Tax=Paramuribaculum intestinale TaxID=2094151 RepID=UPI0025B6CFC5
MESLPFAFICLTSFFTLANPLGTMPVFLSMPKDLDNAQRADILKRATLISFVILIAFTVCGQVLFTLFGISTNGFRIAAGFIIMKIGFDMLQAKYSHVKLSDNELKVYAKDIAITPLAIPMLCGPGAIANGIMLMDDADTLTLKGILIGSIAAIYLLTYLILRASTRRLKVLGDTGTKVMMRLMG